MRRRSFGALSFVVIGAAAVWAVGACSTFGEDGETTPDAHPSDAPDRDGNAPPVDSGNLDAGEDPDIGAPPSDMVAVLGGSGFFIDKYEVTNEQYDDFLLGQPDGGIAPAPRCAWKTSYERESAATCRQDLAAKHPVTCVDWCAAEAYCRFRKKRLCGKLGGGKVDKASILSTTHSQWSRACFTPDGGEVPYGGAAAKPGYCNTSEEPAGEVVDVGSMTKCEGGRPGLFDMTGNALEWEDACDDGKLVDGGVSSNGQNDACYARGGSFENGRNSTCKYVTPAYRRGEAFRNIGFRCCSP